MSLYFRAVTEMVESVRREFDKFWPRGSGSGTRSPASDPDGVGPPAPSGSTISDDPFGQPLEGSSFGFKDHGTAWYSTAPHPGVSGSSIRDSRDHWRTRCDQLEDENAKLRKHIRELEAEIKFVTWGIAQ